MYDSVLSHEMISCCNSWAIVKPSQNTHADIWSTYRKRFADMMRFMTREPGLEPEHTVNGFPWAELGEATVVDLGGSHGAISCALARKYPSLKLVVQVCGFVLHQGKSQGRAGELSHFRTSTRPSSEKQRLVRRQMSPIGCSTWSTTS